MLLQSIGATGPVYEAGGCLTCNSTGYVGRIGLYECMVVDDEIRRMIHANATEEAMAAHAFRDADRLVTSGLKCVAAGITSLSDVLRNTGEGS